MSQKGKAGRDLIQIGRDYVRQIEINILNGNLGAVIILLIPIFLVLFITIIGINKAANLAIGSTLNRGEVRIFSSRNSSESTVWINASKIQDQEYVLILITDIPLAEYQTGTIKLGANHKGEGTVTLYDNNKNKEYKIHTEGTDLTIKLEKNPIEEGKFVKGKIYGTLNNGIERRQISYNLTLPVQ